MKKLEEALPRLKECELEKASRLYKKKTGEGCDGFHSKITIVVIGEGGTKWKVAVASLHNDVLFDSEKVTCERPIALVPTLIRWWEALRAPEVAKWQQKNRVDWDSTRGRNGAQQTVWEIVLEMERFKYRAGEEELGAVSLVLDLAKAFERVSLPVVWAWATHFSFPRKILRVLCRYFEHLRRVQFKGCVAEPLRTITVILPGSTWSCLLLRIVVQDALSEVSKNLPSTEVEGLCRRHHSALDGEEQGSG